MKTLIIFFKDIRISLYNNEIISYDICTHGYTCLTTLLVKHYNDLLDRRSPGWGRDEVTYFSDEDVFVSIHLGTTYANFQEKIFPETPGKKLQTFCCSYVATLKSLELFPRRFRKIFFS